MFALMMVLETNLSWELIFFPESFEDNIFEPRETQWKLQQHLAGT
jgi:hypothetical protein